MWIEFITTTECNWNCKYCNFDKIKNVTFNINTINKHLYIFDILDIIKPVIDLTYLIQGGEIGLVKDNTLLAYFLAKFNKKVIIDTNGTFMETDRSQLFPYIDSIFYHVVDHAANLKKVKTYDLPIPIIHGLTDDNTEEILKFIEYNNHIFFEYVDFEADPNKTYSDKYIQNFYTVLSKNINNMQNTAENLKYSLAYKASRSNFVEQQKLCRISDQVITVDLAREVLCSCTTKGCINTIPLTKENFINTLTGFNNYDENFKSCESCFRSCFSMVNTTLRKQKLSIKSIL